MIDGNGTSSGSHAKCCNPRGFAKQEGAIDKRCKDRENVGKLGDLIENDFDTVQALSENDNFNMTYLEENNGITSENLTTLYKYGKEL